MAQVEMAPAETMATAAVPPRHPGLPLLGNLLPFLRDPVALAIEGYRRHGPIFRLQVPGRRFTVLAGAGANLFAARSGDLFASRRFWQGYGDELDVQSFVLSLDGPDHFRLRKVMQRAYSRGSITRRFPEAVAITRRAIEQTPIGSSVPVVDLMRRAVTQQLGLLLANREPGAAFDAITTFVRTGLNVTVLKRWPRLMLALPGYRRARARVIAFVREILDDHRPGRWPEREPDLIDDLLAAQREGRYPLTDNDLIMAAFGPFVAGLDTTASTCAFMLYALLANPPALQRVMVDVDTLFASGGPTPDRLKDLPALHGAAMETLRLYPIAPFLGRTAVRAFSFAGHAVAAGDDLLVATTLPHHLAEHFPEPRRFDIDRFRPPRSEHLPGGVFAPFGVGPHTCLGGGFAEIQIALTMATLLHDLRFELDPPDQRLRVTMDPTPTPGSRLRVRIQRRK
jgi:cytochrome P450